MEPKRSPVVRKEVKIWTNPDLAISCARLYSSENVKMMIIMSSNAADITVFGRPEEKR